MFSRILPVTLATPMMLILMFAMVTGCSGPSEKKDKGVSETELYTVADEQLAQEQWEAAIKNLQSLDENFPFGTYAEQAQLELMYAYYNLEKPDEATSVANRFIRLHPQHRNVDYAYYMLGLAAYSKGKGIFERVMPTDLTKRDPGEARESLGHFTQLLNRFPDSPYAADAKKRMLYLRNLLARYEIHVANYYFKRGAYLAAVGRGRYVLENYPRTPSVPDALAVMVYGYHLMGMEDRANEMLAVLRDNYAEYPALDKSGKFDYDFAKKVNGSNWFGYLTLGLFTKFDDVGFDTREIYDAEYIKTPRVKN